MPSPRLKTVGLVAALTATALIAAAVASAGSTRDTRGDAQAVFEANQNGGAAILLHSGKHVGPAANDPASGIRISAFVDGRHYCALDWHVIAVTLIDGNFPGETRTPSEIAADLTGFSETFYVDGAQLDTVLTPVKRFVNPESLGLVNGFFFTTGRVLEPSELAVGNHTLAEVQHDSAGNITDTSNVTFVIDPAGMGACI